MKKVMLLIVLMVTSCAIVLILLRDNSPTLLEGNGDSIIETRLDDTKTLTVQSGQVTATLTAFFEREYSSPLVIEVRHNNEIVQLQQSELPLGVTGTLYTTTIEMTQQSKLSHVGSNDFEVFLDGTFSAIVEHDILVDQIILIVLICLLAFMAILFIVFILTGDPKSPMR